MRVWLNKSYLFRKMAILGTVEYAGILLRTKVTVKHLCEEGNKQTEIILPDNQLPDKFIEPKKFNRLFIETNKLKNKLRPRFKRSELFRAILKGEKNKTVR